MTGEDLKALRRRKGWTQGDACVRFGVSQATLSKWESGKQPIPAPYVLYIKLQAGEARVDTIEPVPPKEWDGDDMRRLREYLDLVREEFSKLFTPAVTASTVAKWEQGAMPIPPRRQNTLDAIKAKSRMED